LGKVLEILMGTALGTALGTHLETALGTASGTALGTALGMALGMASDIPSGTALGKALDTQWAMASGIVLGTALGMLLDVRLGAVLDQSSKDYKKNLNWGSGHSFSLATSLCKDTRVQLLGTLAVGSGAKRQH
jgi:hypothetical protein